MYTHPDSFLKDGKSDDLHYFVNNKAPIEFSHDTWDFWFTDFPVGYECSILLESELIHY